MVYNLNLFTTDEFFLSGCPNSTTYPDVVTLTDSFTYEIVNYVKVTNWLDNMAISSNESAYLDGTIYRKKAANVYYAREEIFNKTSLNIKWFGAKGDGISDDTQAFNKISDFVFKQREKGISISSIYIPNGRYKITDTFYIPLRGHLYGESSLNSVIIGDIDGPLLKILQSNTNPNDIYEQAGKTVITNLSFGGKYFDDEPDAFPDKPNGFKPNKIGILVSKMLRVELNNLFIKGFEGYGILYESTYYQTLRSCYFTCNAVGVETRELCTTVLFENCEFRKNSRGIHCKDSFSIWMKNCIFEENIAKYLNEPSINNPLNYLNTSSSSIILEGAGCKNITISECYFEGDLQNIVFDDFVSGNIVRGCFFIGASSYQTTPDFPLFRIAVFKDFASENLFESNTYLTANNLVPPIRFKFYPQAKNNVFKFLLKEYLERFIEDNMDDFENIYIANNLISHMPIALSDSSNQKFERNRRTQIRPYIQDEPSEPFLNDILVKNGKVGIWNGSFWRDGDGSAFGVKRFGSTAEKDPNQSITGLVYFDTQLNKPIFKKNNLADWVYADGSPA
ncbi:glycosyl hydrolase family 28-related protein [Chryseobacterium tructae]|uniref:Glycosyl hydrolase family 28-related protein n=1 Tax=Chryseobacterium tructae TaxID=1037380 RepID=A0ABV7Y0P5_9FLAO|nr:glycosyl hydrolase family 28-related protein [Chryseobacterium tructae]MDN3694410.1 glycosyl hydrolase family 28-related protein [Chryseobacterium tructae]